MPVELNVVEQLVQNIVEIVHPLRIILFGSAVSGKTNSDSDIDLLVIMPEGVHRRKTAQTLYRQIRGIGVPFDIMVATAADIETHKNNIGLLYKSVLQEGVEVYAA